MVPQLQPAGTDRISLSQSNPSGLVHLLGQALHSWPLQSLKMLFRIVLTKALELRSGPCHVLHQLSKPRGSPEKDISDEYH